MLILPNHQKKRRQTKSEYAPICKNVRTSHGADISFLSVYPGEKEVLYPPLTYFRPIRLYKETIGGTEYQVAEVEPVFPK